MPMANDAPGSSSTSRFFLQSAEPIDGEKWELLCPLGSKPSSGIYRLYKARKGSRIYALKALAEEYATSVPHSQLLVKECEIGMLLSHPAVMRTFGMAEVEGLGECIVLEYIDGITLREYLDSVRQSRESAIDLLEQICEAVSFIHSWQVVHLDLKPSNIMLLKGSNRVKIIDFGFADSPGFATLKGVGVTKRYAAPELENPEDDFDNRADIYSLGVIMEQIYGSKPRSWADIAARCKSSDASQRPSDAMMLPRLVRQSCRRRRVRWLAVGSTTGVIGVVCAFLLFGGTEDKITAIPAPIVDSVKVAVADSVLPLQSASESDMPLAAEMQMEEVTTDENNVTDRDDVKVVEEELFENRLYRQALTSARKRWDERLNTLDTLTQQRTLDLYMVGYWKHLAKEDVKLWLKEYIPPESPAFTQMMQLAATTISDYGKDPDREWEATQRFQAMHKRTGFIGTTTSMKRKLPDGTVYVDSLMEDGSYHHEVRHPTPRRSRRR